jgi:hypothetical protein
MALIKKAPIRPAARRGLKTPILLEDMKKTLLRNDVKKSVIAEALA